ncbi:glycerophosphodiester phosphodiesterase family protein [Tateyamaria omphalii]|uniref:GP-PDE domain-containing protein n=1 Tax=Tateyamaria omphalii TaxID=299262 RepID=A0A1P8N0P5_9RHOB|nr:glycerophosphodiester phosphodiesterase family protein [Tateyamaria omphalii]APX13886.1 hypothetical protein BWR18_13400 [Tateyamaria omphalii]
MRPPLRTFLNDTSWTGAIVAHRGAWHHAPENSALAIKEAADRGYDFVELDVQQSWDGTLFCLHDRTLDRTTDTIGAAAPRLWRDLRHVRLREGMGGDAPLTGEHIASLSDALAVAKDRTYLDIDTKFPDQITAVATAVKAAGMEDQVNLKREVNCRADYEALRAMEDATGIIVKPILFADPGTVAQIRDLIVEARFPLVEVLCRDMEIVLHVAEVCSSVQTEVFVNTLDAMPSCPKTDSQALVDPDAVWGALARAQIRLIQTDEPAALSAFLKAAA